MEIDYNLTDSNNEQSNVGYVNMEIDYNLTDSNKDIYTKKISRDFDLLKLSESSTKFWDNNEDSWWDSV